MKDKYLSQKKYMKENLVKLGIDVRPEIRDEFRQCCELNNTLPSRVLKDFVNNYIKENSFTIKNSIQYFNSFKNKKFTKKNFLDIIDNSMFEKIKDDAILEKFIITLKNEHIIFLNYYTNSNNTLITIGEIDNIGTVYQELPINK